MTSRRIALFSDHRLGVGGGEYYTYSLLRALLARYEVDRTDRQPVGRRALLDHRAGGDGIRRGARGGTHASTPA